MPNEYSIAQIISFAKNSQVNSQLKISQDLVFKGGSLNPEYSRLLYLVRKSVEFMNGANPANSTLRQVSEYLFALSRPYVTATATISITNPSPQTVNVGGTANFTVSVFVSNAAPYTIQWYRNSVAIPGATSTTYSLVNAQLTDSGAQFYAVATAPGVGQAVSATVTITVVAPLFAYFSYNASTDYYPILLTNSDPFAYQVTTAITHNNPISIPLPGAMPANVYMLVRVPIGESDKVTWFNTPLNSGTLDPTGDTAWWASVAFGGFRYYASRGQISLDVTQPLIFS